MDSKTFRPSLCVTVAQVGLEDTITDTDTGVEILNFNALVSIQCGDSWQRERIGACVVREAGKLRPPLRIAEEGTLIDVTLDQLHDMLEPVLYWAIGQEVAQMIHEAGIKQFGGNE